MRGKLWDEQSRQWVDLFMFDKAGNKIPFIDHAEGRNFEHISAVPASAIDWTDLPPRPWECGNRLLRGQVSVLTGAGGIGKTALTITCALSMALGRNLLDPGNTRPQWKLRFSEPRTTYIYGLEDDINELKRRIMAVMNFHKIQPHELGDHLICGDGTVERLVMAIFEAGRIFRPPCVEALVDFLIEHGVRVLILDPFIKLHICNENDNGQMDYVMVVLKEIAIRANCAIWLIHHSGKSGTTLDANGSRGASSIIGAARVSETLTPPTDKEREAYGLGEDVVKLEPTKANLAPFGKGDIQYLRVLGHSVGNGDYAQVIELLDVQDQTERMDEYLFDAISEAIRQPPLGGSGVWVSKKGAVNWIGHAVMAAGIGTAKRAEALVEAWIKAGLIIADPDAKDRYHRHITTAVKLNDVMVAKHKSRAFG
jgi:hypothetical protein